MDRPVVTLKCASTLDGYIDDRSPERLILSCAEDRADVERLRAGSGAILVGAQTLRRDNPKLIVPGARPMKVVLTNTGDLPAAADFFTVGDTEKRVYTTVDAAPALRERLGSAASVEEAGVHRVELPLVLDSLYRAGVRSLLVEGGAKILAGFLAANLFDTIRLAIAPQILGDPSAPRLTLPKSARALKLQSAERLGSTVVVQYS